MPTTHERGSLTFEYDQTTGQILSVRDRDVDMQVIQFAPGHELEINERAVPLQLLNQDDNPDDPAWQCNFRSVEHPSIGCAQGYDVFRQVVVGSKCKPGGGHINPPNSLHIRYRIARARVQEYATPDPQSAGHTPIQMPLWLDTVGTLCAKTDWFGPDTQMMQSSPGGCGPRSHVSHEEGAVAEVVPHLWNMFRRTHPGAQMIPGAVYYHADGRWLWITAQRPTVGMHWDYELHRIVPRFQYHARLEPAEVVHTPEVSLYWGRGGRHEMLDVLNEHFIAYEEPPDWFYHTTWFWLHWWQYRPHGFHDMIDNVKYLHEKLGVTGFGITAHDLRPGMWDCGTSSLGPSPHLGGEAGMRKLGETVRKLGGHMFVWLPYMGMGEPSAEMKRDWRIMGEDGRPYPGFNHGSADTYQSLNLNHPDLQQYYLYWIRRYIQEFRVDGIFWDCGGAPLPPDFAPPQTRPFQRFPSECMTGGYNFMKRVLHEGQAASPDFFMWHECFSQDLPATGYSTNTGADAFIMELDRHGTKRFVYRSCSTYNLYGRFPRVNPAQDCAFLSPITLDTYKPMANNAMNKWVVDFVRQNGVRNAVGIQPGVAQCEGHLIVDPSKAPRNVTIPEWAGRPSRLTNVHTGQKITPDRESEAGVTFTLPGEAAYTIDS